MTGQNPVKLLYEVDEVAGMLSLGRSKLYSYILSGQLRSIKLGRRSLIKSEAIHEFIQQLAQLDGELG